jgi:hypothetical protein
VTVTVNMELANELGAKSWAQVVMAATGNRVARRHKLMND